jgi:hypothetical protein
VAAPAFSPLTSLKTNRLRRALGVEVMGLLVSEEYRQAQLWRVGDFLVALETHRRKNHAAEPSAVA